MPIVHALPFAQAGEPIRIVTGEPIPPGPDWLAIGATAAAIAVFIGLFAVMARAARRRRRSRAPDEAAFSTLSRRMHLSRSDRTLLRELSLKAGLKSPVAPLVCRGAFDQLLQAALGRGAPADSIRRIRSLGQRLRWVEPGQVETKPGRPVTPAKAPAKAAPPARPGLASVARGTRRGPGQR